MLDAMKTAIEEIQALCEVALIDEPEWEVLTAEFKAIIKEHSRLIFQSTPMYAIGEQFDDHEFGMWDGPHPSLDSMLKRSGKSEKSRILRLGGDSGPDEILYRWADKFNMWHGIDKGVPGGDISVKVLVGNDRYYPMDLLSKTLKKEV